jgi:hypothetical protein
MWVSDPMITLEGRDIPALSAARQLSGPAV